MIRTTIRAALLVFVPFAGLSAQGPGGSLATAGAADPDPLPASMGPVVSAGLMLGYTAGFGFQVSGQVGDLVSSSGSLNRTSIS